MSTLKYDINQIMIEIQYHAKNIFNKRPSQSNKRIVSGKIFKAFYSLSVKQAAELWILIIKSRHKSIHYTIKHFLWTLCFLRLYPSGRVMSYMFHAHRDVINKWVWHGINILARLNLVSSFHKKCFIKYH